MAGYVSLPPGFTLDPPPGSDTGTQEAGDAGITVIVPPRTPLRGKPKAAPPAQAQPPQPEQVIPAGPAPEPEEDTGAQLPPGFTLDPIAPEPSAAQSFGLGLGEGATLGAAPTIAGIHAASGTPANVPMGLGGLLKGAGGLIAENIFGTPGEATRLYEQGVAAERATQERAQAANPMSYLGGQLAGGLASAAALPAFTPLRAAGTYASMPARLAAGATNLAVPGAIYGGIAGAASADQGGLADRLGGALQGAATGAVLAPAIGAAGAGLGNVLRHGMAFVPASAARMADTAVARRLAQDNTNLPDIITQMRAAQAAGQPVTMADLAGANLQGQIGSVARLAGPGRTEARQFLQNRQIGTQTMPSQGERITDALTQLAGSGQGSLATADVIAATRKALSDPLYQRARATPIPDGALPIDLLPRLKAAGAMQKAMQKARVRGKPFDLGNVDTWDRMKRALDDRISTAKRKGANDDARDFTKLKTELTDAIDKAVPVYGRARRIYAGQAELADALEAGKRAFSPSMTQEALEAEFGALTPGEQEMYRLSAVNSLKDRLANMPHGVNKQRLTYGSPAMVKKIDVIAPTPATKAEFIDRLRREEQMFELRHRALGNSATAERLADDADTLHQVEQAVTFGRAVASGHLVHASMIALRHMAKVDPEQRGRVLDAIRQIALNPNPATVEAFAQRIQAANMPQGVRASVIGVVRNALNRLPRVGAAAAASGGGE